ncbi:DUF7537 family lipoprotein [Halorussus lipolyticus]|uniref:DUF7537 family lipoprotein n=1 Tax=Halorussus lipolyticus TaxID=3034024 RepID=UPI0023E7DC89|nr:hypothetical protein [Halorussus sp. DT80]
MESARAALVVAGLLVLSGCTGSAFGPSETTTPTAETQTTASPTAGNGTATATASSASTSQASVTTLGANTTTATTATTDSLPPGLNQSGVADADELVSAHQRALNNTSFGFWFRANVSVGPASQWTYQRGAVEAGLSPLVVRSESLRQFDGGATRVSTDLWANETTVVVQYSRTNRTELRRYNRTGENLADETWAHLPRADLDSQVTQAWLLELALTAADYDLEQIEERDGRRVVVLRSSEAVAGANFTDLNATVVVDAEGRVHSLSLTAAYDEADENRIHYEFQLTEVGASSVSQPRWVDAAIPPSESANATTVGAEATTTEDANATTTTD